MYSLSLEKLPFEKTEITGWRNSPDLSSGL
jgi:hypothetical protein